MASFLPHPRIARGRSAEIRETPSSFQASQEKAWEWVDMTWLIGHSERKEDVNDPGDHGDTTGYSITGI